MFNNNCVQVSMDVLLEGAFYSSSLKYKEKIKNIRNKLVGALPNNAFSAIFD